VSSPVYSTSIPRYVAEPSKRQSLPKIHEKMPVEGTIPQSCMWHSPDSTRITVWKSFANCGTAAIPRFPFDERSRGTRSSFGIHGVSALTIRTVPSSQVGDWVGVFVGEVVGPDVGEVVGLLLGLEVIGAGDGLSVGLDVGIEVSGGFVGA